MTTLESVGLTVPEILLPKQGVALETWAAVACDQFTSQPEYWADVEALVGSLPSTLHLIFPEIYLGQNDEQRISEIQKHMDQYLADDTLATHRGLVYVERTSAGTVRRGLVVAIDLEAYDYAQGSTSLVRATEGTIVDRLPPRIRVREHATLETPHIMVLIDDPNDRVIGPLAGARASHEQLYDFELMKDGGHLRGSLIHDPLELSRIATELARLAEPEAFRDKYGLAEKVSPVLYAMGDGNHSLATAKAIWERAKEQDEGVSDSDPRRYALVELVNLHDASLAFEPIHRIVFDVAGELDILAELHRTFGDGVKIGPPCSREEMQTQISAPGAQRVGFVSSAGHQVIEFVTPTSPLAVGSLQPFLDDLVTGGHVREIDYVHDATTVSSLGGEPANAGFFCPTMDKHDLFKTVVVDGALPRKTFSMGHPEQKRYYMECRRL